MVDREPHHHPALVALRRLDRALCNVEETRIRWDYAKAATKARRKTMEDIRMEKLAFALFVEAEQELKDARWAACDLLQREGIA